MSYKIKSIFGENRVYLSNTPNDGWRFVRYIVTDRSGNDITISNFTDLYTGEIGYYFVKQNATITAVFEEAAYSITVTQPAGGTVTASLTKASEGDTVNLSYTVNDGYLFRRFIVRKVSDNSEVSVINGSLIEGGEAWYFNMPDGDVTVTAEIPASHAITVQNPENGSINAPSSAATGDTVKVIVSSKSGYAVNSYSVTKTGYPSVSLNTSLTSDGVDMKIFSFTMPDYPVTVSAETEIRSYPITWNVTNCTVNGPSQGHIGDTITFTVTTNESHPVRTISVNDGRVASTTYGIVRKNVSGNVYTYEMTLQSGLLDGYTVNVACDNEGEPGFPITRDFQVGGASITNSAGEEITRAEGGEQVTIRLLYSDVVNYGVHCYFYKTGESLPTYSLPEDKAKKLTGNNTFVMPFCDMTVYTTGTAPIYALTVVSNTEHGTITADSKQAKCYGPVTLTIYPDTGYELTKLIVDGEDVASQVSDNEYIFIMPPHDVSVSEAVFEVEVVYAVSFDAGITEGMMTADKTTAKYGDTVTLTMKAGYAAENLSVRQGNTDIEVTDNGDGTYSFKMPAGEVTVNFGVKAVVYTITYHEVDDAVFQSANPARYTVESEDFMLNNPEREGYTFTGWTGSNGNTPQMEVEIKKGSTGSKEYHANWEEAVPAFSYFSLLLSGQIGVNFYMYLPEIEGIDYTNGMQCWMSFDISGDKSNNAQVFDEQFNYEADGKTYYGYRCYINSLQMADKITAVFTYGNNSITKEYSALDYLDAAMAEPDDDFDFLAAIKNYGHYAQIMLEDTHKNDSNKFTIGTDYAEMPGHSTYTASDYDTVQASTDIYALVNNNAGGSGVTDITYTLNLDSSTAINIYLAISDDYKGNVSAYLNGGNVSIADKMKDGTYVIRIDDIPAHKLATASTVTINAAKTFTLEISALSYVNAALKNYRDDTKLCDAMTALYHYYAETKKYRASHGYTD